MRTATRGEIRQYVPGTLAELIAVSCAFQASRRVIAIEPIKLIPLITRSWVIGAGKIIQNPRLHRLTAITMGVSSFSIPIGLPSNHATAGWQEAKTLRADA